MRLFGWVVFAALLMLPWSKPALAGHDQGVPPITAWQGCDTRGDAENVVASAGEVFDNCQAKTRPVSAWIEAEFGGYTWPDGTAMMIVRLHDRVGVTFWSWRRAPGSET